MLLPWRLFHLLLNKRASSANVLVENTSGELLVLKANYKPYWSLPGGWIDKNETPRQAAVRELLEETGIVVSEDELELRYVIDRISPRANSYLFVFRLRTALTQDVAITLQSKEIENYDWVTKVDITSKKSGRHYNQAPKNWASDAPLFYIEHVIE